MEQGAATRRVRHYIEGAWDDGGDVGLRLNPSDTREVVAEYPHGDRALADRAVASARAAFDGWSAATPQRRFDALDQIGSELLARREELGRLLAREEGKTLPESIGEVARAGQIFKFFAGESLRVEGEIRASVRPGIQVDVTREPLGVVGLIAPWNFPFAIPAWKIAPALAYGNTVVFKPAELVTACGAALAEIIDRARLPPGVFNLVVGRGRDVGQALVDNPLVDAISFTGSQAVGEGILRATAARGAKVQLEMGGKNPLIVATDADLDAAVECAVQGAFFSTGQRCTASSRLIVERPLHDAFVERLVARTRALRVGDALQPGIEIGPVVDERQLATDLRYLEIGQDEGAERLCGGDRPPLEAPGHYLRPAVLLSRPEHRVAREEIFGPVAVVLMAEDFDHAIALANDTPFGLCAGLCTTSLAKAAAFKRRAQVGMTMVNLPTAGVDFHVPFGGRKGSSHGSREQGRHAAEFYTVVKTGYVKA